MTYYGQSAIPEDKIAHAVFGDDFVGTYCEVGAYNGIDLSNTYFFYQRGWQGINFEPHPDNYAALCINQPKAINLRLAMTSQRYPKTVQMMTAPDKAIVTGFNLPEWYVKSEVPKGRDGLVPLDVVGASLDGALFSKRIETVDYISIDTDGTEMDVLRGFDLDKYQPRLMIIEFNHALEEMTEYLKEYDYVMPYKNKINGFWVRTPEDWHRIINATQFE